MTNRELNNRIRKFYREVQDNERKLTVNEWFAWIGSEETKKRFYALCIADDTFEGLTAESLKMLIVLNRKHNFIHHHQFGTNIKIK